MIKKLKLKFVFLCVGLLTALLAMIVITMNIINYRSIVNDADDILNIISDNQGSFPGSDANGDQAKFPENMSPELAYESRFFSVVINNSNELVSIDTSRISSVNDSDAERYAREVLGGNKTSGFKRNFRYLVVTDDSVSRLTFLDCSRQLSTFSAFMSTSITISLLAIAVVAIIMILSSDKIISPIAESYNKQKRFITDAGHEIKTPLTIINANVDVLAMEIGHNECLDDIVRQTKRLTSLTNDLVYLAKMEESDALQKKIAFPISEIVTEGAEQFSVIAESAGKKIKLSIQPNLSFSGDSKAITQLITILMDNAMKYSKDASTVSVSLKKHSRSITLSVSNVTATNFSDVHLNKLFDRFYRTDKSRNSETGGHGIGLSVAKAIVVAHGGKISASVSKNSLFTITATLPTTVSV